MGGENIGTGRRDCRERETKEDFLEKETLTQTPHMPSTARPRGAATQAHELRTGQATKVRPYSVSCSALEKGMEH